MKTIGKKYLESHAVFFEPATADEAEALQQRLIGMGYSWGFHGQSKVAYVGRCLKSGLTALPEGRMFVGEPSDRAVMRHACSDILGDGDDSVRGIARKAAAKAFAAPAKPKPSLEETLRDMWDAPTGESASLRRDMDKLRYEMRQRFDAIEYKQDRLEKTQTEILTQLRELRVLLTPKPDLRVVKKPDRKP